MENYFKPESASSWVKLSAIWDGHHWRPKGYFKFNKLKKDTNFMRLSIVTLAPNYPGIVGTCLGIQFCTLWRPRYRPGYCGGHFSCKSPGRSPPHNPEHLWSESQHVRTSWGRFSGRFLALMKEISPYKQAKSQVCGDKIFCKSSGKSPLEPG